MNYTREVVVRAVTDGFWQKDSIDFRNILEKSISGRFDELNAKETNFLLIQFKKQDKAEVADDDYLERKQGRQEIIGKIT